LSASSFDDPDELRATTYIVRRTVLRIRQVSDSITISTNTHPSRTLTWAVLTSWADAANGPLARVNICGIVRYVLVVVDNYSCYSWFFFLERKDEVFEHFQSLALRLNNEHPSCLKVIHSDNGTEFRNASFDEFCLEHGIDQQFSALRIPQQNGVVERKNRTLVELARTMLDEHRTPRRFWADAISTACYISNQIIFRLIPHLTPCELRFGRKPSVSHFRPFAWKCFVLIHPSLQILSSL
jgi:transposase InsO family protein